MLHKYRLDRVPPAPVNQSPGAITRLWHKTHVTGPLAALPPRSIYEQVTEEHTAIPAPYQHHRFVEYHASHREDVLVMLYKVCLLAVDKYQAWPDEIFVNSQIIPLLRQRSQWIDGVAYNGKYRLFVRNDLRHIPIRTAEYLPPLIKLALNEHIQPGQVIGLIRG